MNETQTSIRLIKASFFNIGWLEDSEGKRITPIFLLQCYSEVGKFVLVDTNRGCFVYHKDKDELIYSNTTGAGVHIDHCIGDIYDLNFVTETGRACHRLYFSDINTPYLECQDIKKISEDKYALKKDGLWGITDLNMAWLVTPRWLNIRKYNKYGHVVVYEKDGTMAIINEKCEYVISAINYDIRKAFSNELYLVYKEGLYGVIKTNGEMVIALNYHKIIMSNNYFIVKQDKYGLYDVNGNRLLECIYAEIIETTDKFVVRDYARIEFDKMKVIPK